MPISGFKDIRQFVAYVEKRGLLRRISVPVNCEFEIAQVTNRTAQMSGGGPALLFENVIGSTVPVLTNLLGSAQRLTWSLSLNSLKELDQHLSSLLQPTAPQDWSEKLFRLGETSYFTRYEPRVIKVGVCQEVVHTNADVLEKLPILTAWEVESGATLRNVSIFSRSAKSILPGNTQVSSGDLVLTSNEALLTNLTLAPNERRPLALVVGGDPGLLFAARAPFLPPLDPTILACGLTGQRVELVRCKTSDVYVPANAEIVIEGIAEPLATPVSVELVQSNGYLAPIEATARFVPTALTHRKNPLFINSVVGTPPHEELMLVKGSERLLLTMLKIGAPEIKNIAFALEGGLYNLLFVSINQTYAGQAQKIMYYLWGYDQLRYLKNIVVVDAECDVAQPAQVMEWVLNSCDFTQDMIMVKGPLSDPPSFGTKIGLDATRKKDNRIKISTRAQFNEKWLEYGIE